MEHEIGLLFGVLGLVAGTIGVFVTLALYKKIEKIESERRDDQKTHFKKLVINNVEEALQLYKSTSILSHRTTFTEVEIDEKTRDLNQFFKKNNENILRLIRDTNFYASMLSVVDSPSTNMTELIEKIQWLTEEFYILDYSVERNKNRWITKERDLQDNKDFIERTLASLHRI